MCWPTLCGVFWYNRQLAKERCKVARKLPKRTNAEITTTAHVKELEIAISEAIGKFCEQKRYEVFHTEIIAALASELKRHSEYLTDHFNKSQRKMEK